MRYIFSIWFLLIIAVSCIFGVMYLVVQQGLRQGANDPQIQIAEDTATALDTHHQLTLAQKSRDIAESLSPFVMTFSKDGKLQSSEAQLDGVSPEVPAGVFDYVKAHGEDRITWQPKTGVRIAAVVVAYNNGYVLAGRNIREVEKQEDNLLKQIFLGWLATVGLTFIAAVSLIRKK